MLKIEKFNEIKELDDDLKLLKDFLINDIKNYFKHKQFTSLLQFTGLLMYLDDLNGDSKNIIIAILDTLNEKNSMSEGELANYINIEFHTYNDLDISRHLAEEGFTIWYLNEDKHTVLQITERGREFIKLYTTIYS